MKRKMIYSSALATLLSASSLSFAGGPEIIPDYFSGLYVGGTGAAHYSTLKASSGVVNVDNYSIFLDIGTLTVPPGALLLQDADSESVDGYGGVQGGFGWTFKHVFYLGVQGFGEFGSQSNTSTSTAGVTLFPNGTTILPPTTSNIGYVTSSTEVRISNDYGVAGKIGYVVAPRSMIYGKAGASWANIKVSNTASVVGDMVTNLGGVNLETIDTNASASTSQQDNKVGLLLALGFEQFIYQDVVSLNVEYDYVNYGTVTAPAVALNQLITTTRNGLPPTYKGPVTTPIYTQASGSAIVNSLLGGINFYFGRNWF